MTREEFWCIVICVLYNQCYICLAGTASTISCFGNKMVHRFLFTVKRCRCGQLPCWKE